MLQPRIIPCLLVHNKGLVKTVKFSGPKYIGDPINAVRIFNEKECDELMILDIDATTRFLEPEFGTIALWAAECRMPLCYGGGIKTVEHARKIIGLGVEKVALSSAAVERKTLIREIASEIGVQSVVVVIDVRKHMASGDYEVFIRNGSIPTGISPVGFAQEMEALGAGEIVVNSIDRDGTMNGYDKDLIRMIRNAVSLPMTVLGGAGSLGDVESIISEHGVMGVAAGSLFVYKGPYKAVLINYPKQMEKKLLINRAHGA